MRVLKVLAASMLFCNWLFLNTYCPSNKLIICNLLEFIALCMRMCWCCRRKGPWTTAYWAIQQSSRRCWETLKCSLCYSTWVRRAAAVAAGDAAAARTLGTLAGRPPTAEATPCGETRPPTRTAAHLPPSYPATCWAPATACKPPPDLITTTRQLTGLRKTKK